MTVNKIAIVRWKNEHVMFIAIISVVVGPFLHVYAVYIAVAFNNKTG